MEKIVFTNGCFDLIHPGHVELLKFAKSKGTKLIVGINSDRSVRNIKGPGRPILGENARRAVLEAFRFVDEVRIFDELTPERLIREIQPDVLVKGGDWKDSEIIGADFLRANGGEVFSVPLEGNFSTSEIVSKITENNFPEKIQGAEIDSAESFTGKILMEHIEVFQRLIGEHSKNIESIAEAMFEAFNRDKKLLVCGNGGSAADAQHIAAEFVGRFETERRALPAYALTTDTSALTAISNDYSFADVFARQVSAHARAGDVLLAISTSGNSENVIRAVLEARSRKCLIIGLTGRNGKKLAALSDFSIPVDSESTARIQEAHIAIAHILCALVDQKISETEITGKI